MALIYPLSPFIMSSPVLGRYFHLWQCIWSQLVLTTTCDFGNTVTPILRIKMTQLERNKIRIWIQILWLQSLPLFLWILLPLNCHSISFQENRACFQAKVPFPGDRDDLTGQLEQNLKLTNEKTEAQRAFVTSLRSQLLRGWAGTWICALLILSIALPLQVPSWMPCPV